MPSDWQKDYEQEIEASRPSEEDIQAAISSRRKGRLLTPPTDLIAPRGPSPDDHDRSAAVRRAASFDVFGDTEDFDGFVKDAVHKSQPMSGVRDSDILTDDFLDLIKRVENRPLYNREKKGLPGGAGLHPSREGGSPTEAYGKKMLPGDRPSDLSGGAEADAQLRKTMLERGTPIARSEVKKAKGDWSKLSIRDKQLLSEAAYNGRLKGSPSYTKHILAGEYEKANQILSLASYKDPKKGTQILQGRIDQIRKWADWEDLPPHQLK